MFFSFRQWAPPFKFVPLWLKVLYDPHFALMLYALPGCISLSAFPFSALSYFISPCPWWNCSSRLGCLDSGTVSFMKGYSSFPFTFWHETATFHPCWERWSGLKRRIWRESTGREVWGCVHCTPGEMAWSCCGDLAAEAYRAQDPNPNRGSSACSLGIMQKPQNNPFISFLTCKTIFFQLSKLSNYVWVIKPKKPDFTHVKSRV